jgi:myo-inositol-1(or 4)-monophosphatase
MRFEPEILTRIESALEAVVSEISPFSAGQVQAEYKSDNQLVTSADRTANRVLREMLVRDQEGWLSEESADDFTRLERKRVWIVDPIDGTRQFVAGIPEWSISIGLIEDGQPIAGGVCNPATKQTFVGSLASGLTYNGKPCHPTRKESLKGALILASRDEVERGEWEQFNDVPFEVKPVGSIAYKLALVAAGLADATWTFRPKHEWDIAGGVALIRAGGGVARQLKSPDLTFNNRAPVLPNLLAGGLCLSRKLLSYLNQMRGIELQ